MDFIALEIETANQWRDSICSIGLVKVKNDKIIDSLFTFINPNQPFDEYYIAQHGITEEMVKFSPTFEEFYPLLNKWLTNQTVVGYYRNYDQSVLEESCLSINQLVPFCKFGCILQFARNKLNNERHFSLLTLAHLFGIPLHLERAEIIANLVLSFEEKFKEFTLHDLTNSSKKIASHNPIFTDSYFQGKNIVFTGALEGVTRSMAAKKIRSIGGIFSNTVTKQTNILIVSNSSWAKAESGHKSSKFHKAEQFQSMGYPIEIIQEEKIRPYLK
ncbi:exonuclease domain-containing protein [Rummeliibacillus pycnus]|uniref:exonuclease domain-containing protein n=1 Tax=Rummeliibacillus pycnus TaxID=101070 RepID=UPI000C9C3EE7|nr:exonuclease domain-containing protein [Rummeliibacillus pycnus]